MCKAVEIVPRPDIIASEPRPEPGNKRRFLAQFAVLEPMKRQY
jgi:hypothetical protein